MNDGLLVSVLYYYTYEIKVVLIKVKSETPEQYLRQLRKAKIGLWIGIVALILSYSLEIVEQTIFNASERRPENSSELALVIVNRVLSIATELPLIALQWLFLIEFLKLKSERSFEEVSCKSKFLTLCFFAILILNSINTVTFNIAQIIVRTE